MHCSGGVSVFLSIGLDGVISWYCFLLLHLKALICLLETEAQMIHDTRKGVLVLALLVAL